MAKNVISPWILFLERNRLFIYRASFKSVLSADFPNDVASDLQIKKTLETEKIVSGLITQTKLTPSGNLWLILADNAVIAKSFADKTKVGAKKEIDAEVKLAPFDHVGWTAIQNGKNLILILANREFYGGISEMLEKLGFHVAAVTPAATLGLSGSTFSVQLGKEILSKEESVYQNSLIFDPEQQTKTENEMSSDPRKNKKLLALLVALILCVLVFGSLVLKMILYPDKPPVQKARPTPTAAVSTPVPTEAAQEVATPSANLGEVRIQVLNASGKPGLAESVKILLLGSGFKLVETGNSQIINSERIQVVYSPNLGAPVRDVVIKVLSREFQNPATRESTSSGDFDAIIYLTNSD